MYVKDKGVNLNTMSQMLGQALFHVLHWCWQNHMRLVVMGMQCKNDVSMPLMI
jgi:hypothetical protein